MKRFWQAASALSLCILLPLSPLFAQSAEDFTGRWGLEISGGGAGWLHVHQNDGYLDAELLWIGGSVLPVSHVYVADGTLYVSRTQNRVVKRDEHGEPTRTHIVTNRLEITGSGDELAGMAYFPLPSNRGHRSQTFTAHRLPPLPDRPDLASAEFGDPIQLFNGKDLTGWTTTRHGGKNGFSVVDGVLWNNPAQQEGESYTRYANLQTEATFEDFNLKVEVNVPEGGNSGIYLRGIYEIQVLDSYGERLDSHHMGGLYSRIRPLTAAEKPPGEWQTMDITLYKHHLTVILNGFTIIDNQPVLGVTGGALTSNEDAPGPIYLQGDHDEVSYRNMVLTPILN